MLHRRTLIAAALSFMVSAHGDPQPRTPIRHLVVIIGENVSFDALYGTYAPAAGQRIDNLRSRGIVREDGLPGPRYSDAAQHRYHNVNGRYSIDLRLDRAYDKLPAPSLVGTRRAYLISRTRIELAM
jgi:phospholipase C